AQAVGTMVACRSVDDQRFLCAAPISHAAGALIVPVLAAGGTVILQQGFEPGRFLQAVAQHRATMTMLVPTMIAAVLDHPARERVDLSSLQLILYGAAPMATDRIRQAMNAFGPILVQSYGQTEAPSTVLLLDRDDHCHPDPAVLASAGRPYPGVRVSLLDDNDHPVVRGCVGELCVRGALVMDGYLRQPEQTAAVFRGGWLHTGDLARQDEHGFYHLVDRKKDVIISGGFNVYPKEVEDVIATWPGVVAVAVIGLPDDKWGEAVTAILVMAPDTVLDADALRASVRARKGAVATPKIIKVRDALPLTSLGKIDKKALRAPFWLNYDRPIN
ncbi:MAG: acyl-CoA synthetase, partial [Lysobacteraceae bacterium]